ncbi:MAG: Gfo/Idh/MocA family oxidoreductase [Chloroflexi bacterium]|nr:Gfo/Idh/MocA family oxidoreductase [Chloroflexota bacterium]
MRIGLIGAGNIGRLRANAINRSNSCELAAVVDVDLKRATAVAKTSRGAAYTDYQTLLTSESVDAVVVSTPPPLHEEIVVSALENGVHVLCEKPLANTLSSARRMVEAAAGTGNKLATGFNFRYIPSFLYLKKTLDSGAIGELDHVRAIAGHVGLSEFKAEWEHDNNVVGGGALMDIGIHMIDLVRYTLGEVADVYGMATENIWKLGGSEDNGFALMRSPEGRAATLQASWSEWKGYKFQIEVYGDRGMVQASYGPMRNTLIYTDGHGRRQKKTNQYRKIAVQEKLLGWQRTIEKSFQLEMDDFARYCQDGVCGGTLADGYAGFRAVEIANAVYSSTESKRAVSLSEPF